MNLLDEELRKAAELFAASEDEARRFLEGIVLEPPGSAPPDPFSDEYREWTWNLYRLISGEDRYTVDHEHSPFDLEAALARPFPYTTGSATVVGGDLTARGHVMRTIGEQVAAPPSVVRVVEFGPGWGGLTVDLVSTGFRVTAVEIDPQFCTLVRDRCGRSANLHVVESDMLTFEASDPFDVAVFFESFHHCSDHMAMLRRLRHMVKSDGVVLFASEPVQPSDYPWGPRLDGLSIWSTRSYGWLELGFSPKYFETALTRTGWTAQRMLAGSRPGAADVIVARPSSC